MNASRRSLRSLQTLGGFEVGLGQPTRQVWLRPSARSVFSAPGMSRRGTAPAAEPSAPRHATPQRPRASGKAAARRTAGARCASSAAASSTSITSASARSANGERCSAMSSFDGLAGRRRRTRWTAAGRRGRRGCAAAATASSAAGRESDPPRATRGRDRGQSARNRRARHTRTQAAGRRPLLLRCRAFRFRVR